MQGREQKASDDHLSSIFQNLLFPLERLTGIDWKITETNETLSLDSIEITNKHRAQAINQLLTDAFGLVSSQESSEEYHYRKLSGTLQETKIWQYSIVNLTFEHQKGIRDYCNKREFDLSRTEQEMRRYQAMLSTLTGKNWDVHRSESALMSSHSLMTERNDDNNPEMDALKENLKTFFENYGYEHILIEKTRVGHQKYYIINAKHNSSLTNLDTFYAEQQSRREAMEFDAATIAHQLNTIFEESETLFKPHLPSALLKPVTVYTLNASDVIQSILRTLQEHAVITLPEQTFLSPGARMHQQRIDISLDTIDDIRLQELYSETKREKAQNALKVAQQHLEHLEEQFKTFVITENHTIRDKILSTIEASKNSILQRIDELDDRIFENFEDRINRFEDLVRQLFDSQEMTIEEAIAPCRETYYNLHNSQSEALSTQRSQFKSILDAHLSDAIKENFEGHLMDHIKATIAEALNQSEQQIQETVERTIAEKNESKESEFIETLSERLNQFEIRFTQIQSRQWEEYSQKLTEFLSHHAATLESKVSELKMNEDARRDFEMEMTQSMIHFQTQPAEEKRAQIDIIKQCIEETFQQTSTTNTQHDIEDIKNHLETLNSNLILNHQAVLDEISRVLEKQNTQDRIIASIETIVNATNNQGTQTLSESNSLNYFKIIFKEKALAAIYAFQNITEGGVDSTAIDDASTMMDGAEYLADILSVTIPGLKVIVGATSFAIKKGLEAREQTFCDSISYFLFNEDSETLLNQVIDEITTRYEKGLSQLTLKGMEKLVEQYLLPCLFEEMSKPHQNLNTQQKCAALIASPENKTPKTPVKLQTKRPLKKPWTAEGLMTRCAVVVEQNGSKQMYVKNNPYKNTIALRKRKNPHLSYPPRIGNFEEVNNDEYHRINSLETVESIENLNESNEITQQAINFDSLPFNDGEQLFKSINESPDLLEAYNELGQTLFIKLASESQDETFEICLSHCLSAIDDSDEEKKESVNFDENQLREHLLQTDMNNQHILHHHVSNKLTSARMAQNHHVSLCHIYNQLAFLTNVSEWDRQRDINHQTPLDIAIDAWGNAPSEEKSILLEHAIKPLISCMFSHNCNDIVIYMENYNRKYALFDSNNTFSFSTDYPSPIFSAIKRNKNHIVLGLLRTGFSTQYRDADGTYML
ncbi:MAG: hypothetical protein ACE365_06990, partial [Gammaproteobacteria bacterium]